MTTAITRRDFLNGTLIAAGGFAVARSSPLRAFAALAAEGRCDGPVGEDARAVRGGNLRRTFNVAHWMRDNRLAFTRNAVSLAKGCDTESGSFPLADDGSAQDLIVVGSGISGLSTAIHVLMQRPAARILILDANPTLGGNARLDDAPPLPVSASTAGSYCVAPYADFQTRLYKAIGLDWEKYKVDSPFYSYYFDDRTPGVLPGRRGWNLDTYGKGVNDLPYPKDIVGQLLTCKADFAAWGERDGAPTDPPDDSDPKYDYLSRMTLDDYIVKELKCDPIVSDFYTRYTVDALGGTTKQVNAHSAICFLGGEYNAPFAFPGGNAGLAAMMVAWLERAKTPVRIQQDSVALRVDQGSVVYYREGRFLRASAKTIVIATGSHSSQHLVGHLADPRRREAWRGLNTVPVVVANVAVRSAAPFVDAGHGYNQYWWGSKYWADFVLADWASPSRTKRDRPTVLTFFGGNTAGPDELANERFKLLETPFGDYEQSIRDDLSRIMAGTAFDVEKDITAMYLYRWGHGMLMPTPGQVFGTRDRRTGRRHLASAALGRISFAGQDTEGTPSVECAVASGVRAAREVVRHL
jgi:spermidine dehydrogenase